MIKKIIMRWMHVYTKKLKPTLFSLTFTKLNFLQYYSFKLSLSPDPERIHSVRWKKNQNRIEKSLRKDNQWFSYILKLLNALIKNMRVHIRWKESK